MAENENDVPLPEGGGSIWLYGGISAAIIVVGVVIFFFMTRHKPQLVKTPETATSTPASVQSATFPTGGVAPDISVDIQKTDSNKQSVVVQWKDLPSGTTEINVFHAAANSSTSVLVGKIAVPSSTFFNGSSSLNIPSSTQDGYYYGTPNVTSTPPGGGQGSSSTPSSTDNGNPPPPGGGSPSSTGGGNTYFSCVASQCASTSTPGATSCDTACSLIPANTILTSVCLPNAISVGQTSQCVLDLNGVVQNDGTWTMAPGSTGAISATGTYTPSTAGTETITGTLPDGTSADTMVTVSSTGQSGPCGFGYVLQGGSCVTDSSMKIQSTLTWNGSNYSVENGLYTPQDMVYISNLANGTPSNITVYCSYSQYSVVPQSLGSGNYEITGLSSHGCNTPHSINYLNLGGFYGDGLDISITAP